MITTNGSSRSTIQIEIIYKSVFTCSKLTIDTLEQGAKYVQG